MIIPNDFCVKRFLGLVLTTDGITDALNPDEISDVFSSTAANLRAQEIVRKSFENGATDNLTCFCLTFLQ